MKLKILALTLLLSLSLATQAGTCTYDAEEMVKEIRSKHYITTKNHVEVLEVFFEREIEQNQCEADCGDYDIAFKCVWSKGGWGNTLMAYPSTKHTTANR